MNSTRRHSRRTRSMRVSLSHLPVACALLLTAAAQARAQDGEPLEKQFRAFADTHCVSCHGPDVQRSNLRLDNLPLKLSEKDSAATWAKVFDRVSRGEMP